MSSLDDDSHGQEIEKILRKSYKFCHPPVLQPVALARSTWQVKSRDCLPDVYISENAEWIAEEFSLSFRPPIYPQYQKLPNNSYPKAYFWVLETCILSLTLKVACWHWQPDLTDVNTCTVCSHWHEWLQVGVRDLKKCLLLTL